MSPLDEQLVRRLYLEEGKTISAIADELGCARRTVYDAMIRWRIPRRPRSSYVRSRPFDATVLRRRYLDEGATLAEIAREFDVSVSLIRLELRRAEIATRPAGPRPKTRT
jgi:transposase-like protein